MAGSNRSWACGPPVKHKKFGGAGLRARPTVKWCAVRYERTTGNWQLFQKRWLVEP